MKKTLFLLITILTISFIGCSDDDDSEYKDAIIGTWELTQIEFGGGWTSIPRRTYATFNSDGTYNGRGYFGNGSLVLIKFLGTLSFAILKVKSMYDMILSNLIQIHVH